MKRPTLQEVDDYEVPSLLADRIERIHKVPADFAQNLIKEAKRMLYLCCISDEAVAPPDRIDWAWHEMLMFTRFYRDFSDFLGDFIHHVPNPAPEENEQEETWEEIQKTLGVPRMGSDTYNLTKKNYKKYFHEDPNPLYWP